MAPFGNPSTVPAVKAYLFAQLQARPEITAGAKTLVSYDDPGPYQPDDIIVLGDVSRSVAPLAMVGDGGPGWLQENYTQSVVVSVYRGLDSAQAAFERAALLADVVIDVVRVDPSLGGLVTRCWPLDVSYVSDWNTQDQDDGTVLHLGRSSTVTIPLSVFDRF
jgi:hypothetical protein